MKFSGPITRSEAESIAERLLAGVHDQPRLAIDFSDVTTIDCAGLQTLLAARRYAASRGVPWRVTGWCEPVATLLDEFRCADLLDGSDEEFEWDKYGELVTGPAPVRFAQKRGRSIRMHNDCWHWSIRFSTSAFTQGNDPLAVLGQLRQFGEIIRVKLAHLKVPMLPDLAPRDCHLGLEVDVRSSAKPQWRMESGVFVFGILAPFATEGSYRDLLYHLPEDPRRTALDWWDMGSIDNRELGRFFPTLPARLPSLGNHVRMHGYRGRRAAKSPRRRIARMRSWPRLEDSVS